MTTDRRTPEYIDVTPALFEQEIAPRNRPAILRGLVAHWPAVQAAKQSAESVCAHLKRFDRGAPVDSLVAKASSGGRFFYTEDLRGFNFRKHKEPISVFLDRLLANHEEPTSNAMYVQSAPIPMHLPQWDRENVNPLLPAEIFPRIWIGNAVTATTHSDLADNLACLVAGKRRFTLFPPEQLRNLYIGPLEFSPAGRPVSMVDLEDPDFDRYPKFAEALACAEIAELEPGDAIYIPYYWWHHVRSLAPFNVLVNYWWNEGATSEDRVSPYEGLMLALLTIRGLPLSQRNVWREIFEHYVFLRDGDPAEHIVPERRGVLGSISAQQRAHIKGVLARLLAQS